MISEFRKKKLMYLFKVFFDADRSGSVTKDDFHLTIKRLATSKGWTENDEKYKIAESTLLEIWKVMQLKADKNKDGVITSEAWLEMWENFDKDTLSPVDWLEYFCKAIFYIQDTTGDGEIDKDEFISVQASFGLSRCNCDATVAYGKVSQGKTSLTYEDYQKLWNDFFSSEDVNAPGNFIFGNLSFD